MPLDLTKKNLTFAFMKSFNWAAHSYFVAQKGSKIAKTKLVQAE